MDRDLHSRVHYRSRHRAEWRFVADSLPPGDGTMIFNDDDDDDILRTLFSLVFTFNSFAPKQH